MPKHTRASKNVLAYRRQKQKNSEAKMTETLSKDVDLCWFILTSGAGNHPSHASAHEDDLTYQSQPPQEAVVRAD